MELTFLFYWQPSTKSPEDLPNAVTDDTGGKVADTKQGKVTADHATLKSIKRHSISYPSFKACNFFFDLRCFCFRHRGEREFHFEEAGQQSQRLWHGLREDIVYILVLCFFLKTFVF